MIRVFNAKELINFFIKIMIPLITIWLIINSISNVRGTAKFTNSKVLFACLDEHFEKIKTSTINKNSSNEEGNYEDGINGAEVANNENDGQTGTTNNSSSQNGMTNNNNLQNETINNSDLQNGMTNSSGSQIKNSFKYLNLIAKELPVIKSISTESLPETKITDEIKIAEENENKENDQTKEERK